jgi:hypothetical protein
MFPAFKEWQVIVDALGAGAQTLILRKGGIAEDKGGFRPQAGRFWLFPTHFHEQRAKTKPATLVQEPAPLRAAEGFVTLRFCAEVVHGSYLTDWEVVRRLDPFHLWTEATIRERFQRTSPPGIHVLLLRTYRMEKPLSFPVTKPMGGCRSWIALPYDPAILPSQPVLADVTFAESWRRLRAIL